MSKDNIELPLTLETCNVQLNELPDEIIEFILTYLPPYKDLECCSLVCKRWNAIVKNLIRRSKNNLHKGLLDFRLRWEIFTQQTAAAIGAANTSDNAANLLPASALPIIAGRFSHSAVRHENSMYIFGGGSSSDTTFNDLWRFDLSEMRWERPLSMGSYPSPKGSASMVCWRDQLILFGGWRYPSLYPPYQPWCLFDELHYYDLTTHRWTVRVSLPSPPPMAGHSASVHGNRMIVFGGYQIGEGVNSNSNETWCLDLLEHRWWQPRIAGNTKPPPRYGQFQLELDDEHLLIVGGCGGPNSVYSDAWLLDMSREVWSWRLIPVRNKKFGALHMWCHPACKVDNKMVVLGPAPNMPQDFLMMKSRVMPALRFGGGQEDRNNPFQRQRAMGDMGAPAIAVHNNRLDNFRFDPVALGGGAAGAGAGLGGDAGGINAPRLGENFRRAILNQHQQNANNNLFNHNHNTNNNNNNNNNNGTINLQPRTGRLSELHATAVALTAEERNRNRPSTSSSSSPSSSSATPSSSTARLNGAASTPSPSPPAAATTARNDNENIAAANGGGNMNLNDIEAANRLQRNLALRFRDNEPRLPKRFDELYEDPFRMAAFNVQNRPRILTKDHNERIRRMEEKMNAIRNSRRTEENMNAIRNTRRNAVNAMIEQKPIKEPSPKRIKRNVLSLFVCDLASALNADDPHLHWVEYKNYGIIPGAPERLILSTMVVGHGELILFGGVHKETLSEITHQVSNTIHFLSAPRDIV